MNALPADFRPEAIQSKLATRRLGQPAVTVVATTGSTNGDLLAEARRGAQHGRVLVTDHQTAGRGRLDRGWDSESGADLLFSVLLKPPTPRERFPEISLVAGVAAHAAIARQVGEKATLKWPNDVLIGRDKVCGILCQQEGDTVVVGLGVNVNSQARARSARSDYEAVSLRDVTGSIVPRGVLLAEILNFLENEYDRWLVDPPAVFRDWEQRAGLPGRRVKLQEPGGEVEAEALGIDECGRLLVSVAGRRRLVVSGDVFLVED
ncbi:MAG: biotin--[acetyl-CoA-carboxylase] ligase [Candidatus Lernaella stagnicola]|nr:biotin--[acetyl-CoA-carboxylase] ligase [Candidatus Lernaella stagnicola]